MGMAMNTQETGRSQRHHNERGNGNGYGSGGYSHNRNYRQSGYNHRNNQDTATIRIQSQYRQRNHHGNDHHQNHQELNNHRPQRLYNRSRGGLTENRGRGRGRGNKNLYQRKQWKPKDTQSDAHAKEKEESKQHDATEFNLETSLNVSKGLEYKLKDNGTIWFYEHFMDESAVQSLWKELMTLNFQQPDYKVRGRIVKLPRLQSHMKDKGVTREMASLTQTQEGHPWSKSMTIVKNKIEKLCNCKFQYVLINWYRNGKDSIGWHCDDEAIPKCKNVVGSVSLGGPREFIFRHKDWKKKKIPQVEFVLTSRCLVVMKDDTQVSWQHSVPKSRELQNPRINLTFRQICSGCKWCKPFFSFDSM